MAELKDIVLDKLWNSYQNTTSKRRSAFFRLYYALIVIGILIIFPVDNGKIKFFTFEFERWICIMFSPAVILILLNNYLYLSSHTVVSYSNYLNEFINQHSEELEKTKYSFSHIYNSFRLRDVTTNLNLFTFPSKTSLEWDEGINKYLKYLTTPSINIAIWFTYLIPFMIFIFLIQWNIKLEPDTISKNLKTIIISTYIFLGSSFILAPIYFFGRVRKHNKRIAEYFNQDNRKLN